MDKLKFSIEVCQDNYILCIKMDDNSKIYIQDLDELSEREAVDFNIHIRPEPPHLPATALEGTRLHEN